MDNKSGRQLHKFSGGLNVQTFKHLSNNKQSLITPLPNKIILPMQQHIGTPAIPLVKKGDQVLKGQKIAAADGYVSLPIHATTSGKVIDIDLFMTMPDQPKQTCIIIEPDGNDAWFELNATDDYLSISPDKLQHLILEAGIAGMGGAGFPAFVKLSEGTQTAVDTLIINGVECEPYISCDDRIIREKADYIIAGTRMLRHAIQAKYCVVAVEDDMPEAFNALDVLIDDDIELIAVPAYYPSGGEKQLIKILTGREVPSGGLPIDIGIVMHNVGTAAAAYRTVTRGEPLVSRYLTVSGTVAEPCNLQVLLGTPVEHCLQQVGYQPRPNDRIVMGGPMMGKHVTNLSMPIIKTTNSILVIPNQHTDQPEMPCIRCGLCVDVCPANLLPQELFAYSKVKDFEQTRALHLFDCIECGCCAYTCPSNIPLVQYYRQAKRDIAEHEKKKAQYQHTKSRFEARNERLLRNDQRFAKNNAKPTTQNKATDTDSLADKKNYIKAATERIKQKRNQDRNQDK